MGDARQAMVYMVAVDGSQYANCALQLCSGLARADRDEVVGRVFGPPEFTEPVQKLCTDSLQSLMRIKKIEYAVVPTELDDEADVIGEDLADAARECRFKRQAFLVFGARGRGAEHELLDAPLHTASERTTLGKVANWCLHEAQCSLIIARPKKSFSPQPQDLVRTS